MQKNAHHQQISTTSTTITIQKKFRSQTSDNPPTRVGVHSLLIYVDPKFVPKFKIQNPKSEIHNPKSKIRNPNPKFGQKDLLHNVPKSKIQNPKSEIQNPKSKIQNQIQNPKSKIQIRNPKSEIQNPKSEIPCQNPKIWGVGASQEELLHNDPKSKIPKIRPKKFGFWILDLGILDFGASGFWILDSRGCATRQSGDCAWRSAARIPLARLWGPRQNQLYLI